MEKGVRGVVLGLVLGLLAPAVPVTAQEQGSSAAAAPQAQMQKMWSRVKGCPYCTAVKMVATEDGGVVVLAGDRLLKYDKDLNLIKKVTVDVKPSAMCPWKGRKGSGGGMMMKGSGPMMGEPGGM